MNYAKICSCTSCNSNTSYKSDDNKTAEEMNASNWASDNVESDPFFLDVCNNFKLKEGSVAIGKGTLKYVFPIDFKSNRRLNDFDITIENIDLGLQEIMDGN